MDYNELDLMTIAELPSFMRQAEKLLSPIERQGLISYLSHNPQAGVLLEDTGGIRKLRWARGSLGKRGGVRVIYYFHSAAMPLYLLTLFAKGEKANISKTERRHLADLVKHLVETWSRRHE